MKIDRKFCLIAFKFLFHDNCLMKNANIPRFMIKKLLNLSSFLNGN